VKIERRGEPIYLFLWAARDVDTKEVLTFRASFTRSSLDAEIFLKQILEYCENKPLFLVDKGPWYREAFETEIEVINSEEKTPKGELVEDLITIVSHFAGKLYGMRSRRYKEVVEGVRKLVSG